MSYFLSSPIAKKGPDEALCTERTSDFEKQSYKICQQGTGRDEYLNFQLDVPDTSGMAARYNVDVAQKWLTLPGKNGKIHEFPVQTLLPKVNLLRKVPARTIPRVVAVERLRKKYEKYNFNELFAEAGLTKECLFPTEEQYYLLAGYHFQYKYPLSFFDCAEPQHSPAGWLRLGVLPDGERYPIPARAFVPIGKGLLNYGWEFVAVTDYNYNTNKWVVNFLMEEEVYELPKIQVMFLAEDPHEFINSLKDAQKRRNEAECLTTMEYLIDCKTYAIPEHDMIVPIKGFEKLYSLIPADCQANFARQLRKEIFLVFEHLMSCFEFEKFARLMPKEFPNVDLKLLRDSLPGAILSKFSKTDRGYEPLELKTIKRSVLQTFFYYIKAGIDAMMNVAAECQYAESLSIFVNSFAHAVPLNEFLQAQQQQSSHTADYLKKLWPGKLSEGIITVLRPNGRGWLDITLDKWSVYQMCKISKFIYQVKLRMEDSVQLLLEQSINNFSNLLLIPCQQFLQLKPTYAWTSNYIDTEFPYSKPIFSLIIGVSEDHKVVYSTQPEELKPALLEIFKKSLEKTSGVRMIDAETLPNLRFAPNLYIMTVELIEELYIDCAEKLSVAYSQAVIPLNAYAKLYTTYIEFYLLDVNEFMTAYKEANKPSMLVKHDILDHKEAKEELKRILPANITIGPFFVVVDPLKQYLIKKHTEIIKRLFDYYINRMFDVNQAILDRSSDIYRRLTERPISIEHLLEARDFSLTVPDCVEELRADIQVMWLEYELLDSFFYNLSDFQFSMKWQAYGWPHKILARLMPLKEEQKIDIEDFKRAHLSECMGLLERLESLNEEVQAFSLHFNPNKVVETSVEVKKLWKTIQELEKQSQILSYRQTLFELEPLNVRFLESIIQAFEPYRTLWSTCGEVLKMEEVALGNPIATLELEEIWNNIQQMQQLLKDVYPQFAEKPEVQNVADVYLKRLADFMPIYNAIKWLKNEYWLGLHWLELVQRSGMDFKYTSNINFQFLMRKGIMQHLDLVHEISEKAEEEAYEIRRQAEAEEQRQQDLLSAMLLRKEQRKCRRDIL